jgi:hypothetical protein
MVVGKETHFSLLSRRVKTLQDVYKLGHSRKVGTKLLIARTMLEKSVYLYEDQCQSAILR